MLERPELSLFEYQFVANMLSFGIAAMFAGAIFFLFARNLVAPKYRLSMLITAIVPAIAFYHYYRIYESWNTAYTFNPASGTYTGSGAVFNDAYRYMDWLLTVPLLTTELVLSLGLAAAIARSLSIKLAVAAALMIVLGYPGEIADALGIKMLFWSLSMIPFLYILYILFTEFTKYIQEQPASVQPAIKLARTTLLITWFFYPIAFLFPIIGLSSAQGEVFLQVGYSVADVLAKVGFGVVVYYICHSKSVADGWSPDGLATAVPKVA
ncbi:MAG: bacteriorhodopsin-like [Sumerlaeia bacterium]